MKYKQILAVLLAMSMTGYAVPAGAVESIANSSSTSDSLESESQADSQEQTTEESADNADNMDHVEQETPEASSEEEGSYGESSSDTTDDAASADTNAEENTVDVDNQNDTVDDVQTAAAPDYSLDITQFKKYDANTNTITIENTAELILLSHCSPEAIENITIRFNITGNPSITKPIEKGTTISEFINNATTAVQDYTFQGIGTSEHPFKGTITGTLPELEINTTFFGGLSSSAKVVDLSSTVLTLKWSGTGDVPMLASVYQFDSEETDGHTVPVKLSCVGSSAMGSLFGTVRASDAAYMNQVLNIDSNIVTYGNNVNVTSSTENAGLICNTLQSGNICISGYKLPANSYNVQSKAAYDAAATDDNIKSAAGNAGGLIGVMKENTTLNIKSAVKIPNNTKVISDNGNAGGLVGMMQTGAKITTEENAEVILNNADITGGTAAGGVVGAATDVLFDDNDLKASITSSSVTVKTTGGNTATAGGFIGKYILNASVQGEKADSLKLSNQIEIKTPTLIVKNSGIAGGYFGYLELKGKLNYVIGGADPNTKKELKLTVKESSAEGAGAIAGKVTSDTITGTLLIQNIKTEVINSENEIVRYAGGLLGEQGTESDGASAVYLKVSNADIKVQNPYTKDEDKAGFGGVAGLLAQGSILKTEDTVTVATPAGNINRGGGLAGYAEKCVIDLGGKLDLSGAVYEGDSGKNVKTGWLVGRQDCALIYAEGDGNGTGWSYIRGKENTSGKQAMNDIGNYGQIIRLKSKTGESASKLSADLITIDDNHAVVYKNAALSLDGNTLTAGSEDAFALLAITWNSRGYFGGMQGISNDNFSVTSFRTKNIELSANIDLTGSGIAGLTRDTYTDDGTDTYTGTFEGNNYTVILAIGETFGYKQSSTGTLAVNGDDGYGEVISGGGYYHGRQGIFAKVAGATIQNLKIDGQINISNAGRDILAGAIAGELSEGKTTTVLGVTVEPTIKADCANNDYMIVGGFFGGCYNDGAILQLGTLDNTATLNTAAATIQVENCTTTTDDTKICIGGVIGEVGESSFSLMADQLQVKGSITTSAKKRAYVGGLIGIIKGSKIAGANKTDISYTAEANHNIEIKGVEFNGFKIDAPTASEVCGGLFGSIWSNVDMRFMKEDGNDGTEIKLDVKNAEINAPKAQYVGGLAYRSSGRWEIRDYGINLEKLSVKAGRNVGLLVCKGEKNTDTVAGGSRTVGSLYLSTTKYWNTSYQISEGNVSISTSSNGVFDEFVAYTTPSAGEILDNGKNGVISIATKEENGIRVGIDTDGCTTYQNRTTYGKAHSTNACSRYYYDLDQCLVDVAEGAAKDSNNNQKLDTPQELLLWSVYNYVCQNVRNYFTKTSISKTSVPDITTPPKNMPWAIGNTTEMDMSKYSYYPIKFANGSVNVRSTTLRFNNERIEKAENTANNKSTQGTNNAHSQHYTMHSGLFLDYQSVGGRMTVSDITFTGNIGKVDNSTSGVLVSNFASGNLDGTTIKSITINMSNIVFDGLKVNNCGNDYAPLLINNLGDRSNSAYTYGYITLNMNGVTVKNYEKGTVAASSMIGTVGSYKAKQINLTFQNIALPDEKVTDQTNGIFSHATLLEHFAYSKDDNGSGATYNFYSSDDWKGTEHTHKVTYGKEITGTTEFTNLQKWYYDEATYGSDDGLVYDDANNKKGFDSTTYLPYVCTAYNKDNNTHEIKVNQRVVDITHGCGTYGHPYRITKEQEMNVLSDYMATGEPRKDWRVTVTSDQNTSHTAVNDSDYTYAQDITYQYDGNGNWVEVKNTATDGKDNWQTVSNGKKIGKEFMHQYLLNAYYDIRGTVVKGSDAAGTSTSENKLVLKNFKGFGTEANPFRGVITSSNNTTIVLQGEETGNGFIPYSYGSVVKNLKISYEGEGKILTYGENGDTFYPKACFGGVIGCVLGGDNIVDNVTVDMADNWLTLSGDKKHLLQVGGYIGSVAGGGVIFRNMKDKTGLTNNKIMSENTQTMLADAPMNNTSGNMLSVNNEQTPNLLAGVSKSVGETDYSNLYVNPYVGRVLDGFAFYEADSKDEKLDNTNKNYKINTLVTTDTDCLDATGNTVTVKNAQGLLLLSAIVNSGAASNGISHAYSRMGNSDNQVLQYTTADNNTSYSFGGRYGKVRNATYGNIGKTEEDAALSMAEDKSLPGEGNLPYLIRKYCGNKTETFAISTNSNTDSNTEMNLTDDNTVKFDMTDYGNGYQGISARYVSNAVRGHQNGNIVNHPEGVIPELKTFNGNGKTITMKMEVREYKDDDFHAASVGGVFNALRINQYGSASNITIDQNSQNIKPVITLEYYDENGKTSATSKNTWASSEDVGVGGFAGNLVGYTNDDANRDITIGKIQANELTITGPASTGGIFGNTGKPTAYTGEKSNSDNIAVLVQPQNSQIAYGIAFNDCSYKDITVTGKYAAGGFAGYIGNKNQNPRSTVNGNGFEGTLTRTNTGESSTIAAMDNASRAGGLFGYVETRMFINMTDEGAKKENKTILQGVDVSAGNAAGGCIGYINGKCYGIHNVSVQGKGTKAVQISLNRTSTSTSSEELYTAGIVGCAKGAVQGWTPNWTYAGGISGSSIKNIQINDEKNAAAHDYEGTNKLKTNYIAGGMIGQADGGKIRIEDCNVASSAVYGSVAGGITGQTNSEMQCISCSTTGSEGNLSEVKGFSTAGGILGFWTGGNAVTIQDCKVQYLDIEGKDWGVGSLVGDADGGGVGTLYLFDSSMQDSNVTASGNRDSGGGRWPCVGSITGNLRNTIIASNVLISGMTLDAANGSKSNATRGMLFGNVANDGLAVNIAGISIQNVSESNKDWNLSGNGKITTDNDYIAFSDYSGTSTDPAKAGNGTDLLGYNNNAVNAPYVVTSPKSTLSVYADENAEQGQNLYGDGAFWKSENSEFTTNAQEIWNHKSEKPGKHYNYGSTGVTNFDFNSAISTYNANQSKDKQAEKNLPVLQVSSGNADVVADYINILTNGGFAKANACNTSSSAHVSAKVNICELKNGKFVIKDADNTESLRVNVDANNRISFSTTTNYDNDKGRFTLLTVTFTEAGHTYNVQVPILVKRMLEMNFTATLSYGTNYRSKDYESIKSHVLESYGSSITGYLTYTYDSDENGVYTDFGWQSYMNAGGNVADAMKKSIYFAHNADNLPAGTQLSLINSLDGKVYYYTATGKEENKIPLGSFVSSDGENYQEPSMADLLHAKAKTDKNGLFVKTDANGKIEGAGDDVTFQSIPTVKIKNGTGYDYYRLAASGETGNYTIEVDESSFESNHKSTIKESYFLVVTVPKTAGNVALNGTIQTIIESDIPHQMNYVTIQGGEDNHSNTASSYQLSGGYQQKVKESSNITEQSKKLTASDNIMKVDVVDKITFPNGQAYLDEKNEVKDELYQRFTAGLQKTIDGKTTAERFPTGATGTVSFFVYKEEGTNRIYYKYENGTWSEAGNTEQASVSYPWVATNGSMELPLSTDGTNENAISLQKVRDLIIKGNQSSGESSFYVEARMDVAIPASGLGVVPEASADNLTNYTKLAYTSQLSTEKQRITYSTNRAACNDPQPLTAYYRDQPIGTKLTYEADQISQLGINLLDLQYLDASREHSLIDTTASYDLSSIQNLEDRLKNSSGVRFTLSLQPKNNAEGSSQEEYQSAVQNAKDDYLNIQVDGQNDQNLSYSNGIWSWTVSKDHYWNEAEQSLKTDGIFNGTALSQKIQLKVNVNDVAYFSNYRVILTAVLLDQDGNGISGTDVSDNIIYTITKIKVNNISLD